MPTDAELRGYLLGEASDDACGAIERAYLAREEALEAVAEAERTLIDDYLSGLLPPAERTLFESRYLATPAHRRRVAIARALRGGGAVADRRPVAAPRVVAEPHAVAARRAVAIPRARQWVPWAMAAALAIGMVGVVWRLQAPMGGAAPIIAVTIPAVIVRGDGEMPTAAVTDDAATIELRLERVAADPCAALEVTLRTVEGAAIWRGPASGDTAGGDTRGGDTATGNPLVAAARIPARQLPDGDYVVLLTCAASPEPPLQRSSFRVVRR